MADHRNGQRTSTPEPADRLGARLSLLADPDARRLVDELAATEGVLCVRELAERVAGPEGRTHETDALRVKLHHICLPELRELGAVNYDAEDGQGLYHGDDLLERCLAAIEAVES